MHQLPSGVKASGHVPTQSKDSACLSNGSCLLFPLGEDVRTETALNSSAGYWREGLAVNGTGLRAGEIDGLAVNSTGSSRGPGFDS